MNCLFQKSTYIDLNMVVQENQPTQRAVVLNKISSINANMNRQQSVLMTNSELPSQTLISSTQVIYLFVGAISNK
jgi:hypothetical protein